MTRNRLVDQGEFPNLDAEIVKADGLEARIWVKENYDRFYNKDEAQATWRQRRRDHHVPKPHMRIAGDDSIMEALFTPPNATGRHIPQAPLRCSQSNTTFAALTFLSFKLPVLHEVDIEILVDAWEGSKHKPDSQKRSRVARSFAT